jgi:hypothetical protein
VISVFGDYTGRSKGIAESRIVSPSVRRYDIAVCRGKVSERASFQKRTVMMVWEKIAVTDQDRAL